MKKYSQYIKTIGFLFTSSLFLLTCVDDDISTSGSILPYDSAKHIYGTFGDQNEGTWEIVIDPATGQHTKIVETEENFSGLSSRLGALGLTSFERNERIYIPPYNNSKLIVQDLETFTTTEIIIKDTLLDKTVIFPQFLRFGVDQNELYLMDTDHSIWKIDLESKDVNKIHNGIPVSNGTYISNLFYIESTGDFLGMANNDATNDYTGGQLFLFDIELPDETSIISTTDISRGFGFVQHPVEKNDIYYIQTTTDDKGFRLMKIEMNGNSINTREISTTDLPIDQLSLYLQTIHTASDSYILRGGSNSIEDPANTLYTIDLESGVLRQEIEIDETGFLMKLAGE